MNEMEMKVRENIWLRHFWLSSRITEPWKSRKKWGKQKRLLRSLFNVRMPGKICEDFLKVQDEYLQQYYEIVYGK